MTIRDYSDMKSSKHLQSLKTYEFYQNIDALYCFHNLLYKCSNIKLCKVLIVTDQMQLDEAWIDATQ